MKYLTLIRHAKSSWDSAALPDHDRPLNERGLHNAPLVGGFLARTYFGLAGAPPLLPRPDHLVTSTALRARTTAELMLPEMRLPAHMLLLEPRAYLAEPRTLLQIVRGFHDDWNHVLLFGHNPGISDFADNLVKRGGVEEMPTCAAAIIELPWDAWAATGWNEARLIGYITPRLIQKRFPDGQDPTTSAIPDDI